MSELDVSMDGGKSYTTLAHLGDNNKCKRRAKRVVEETPIALREHLCFRIYSMGERLQYESVGLANGRLTWKKTTTCSASKNRALRCVGTGQGFQRAQQGLLTLGIALCDCSGQFRPLCDCSGQFRPLCYFRGYLWNSVKQSPQRVRLILSMLQ